MMTRARLAALLSLVLVAALAPGASSAATPAPATGPRAQLFLSVGVCGISGTSTGIALDRLRIRHVAPDGTLRASYRADIADDGGFVVGCSGPVVRPGDRLRLFSGNATTPFRTFTMPKLTLTIDRVADEIRGVATGGVATVLVRPAVCDAARFECQGLAPVTSPVNATTKRYRLEPSDDVTGRWDVEVEWSRRGDRVVLARQAPHLVVKPGSAMVRGAGPAIGGDVTVSVVRGQKQGSGSATAGTFGSFQARVRRAGSPMPVQDGDVVSASIAADASLTVPVTQLYNLDSSIDGQCFEGGDVVVLLFGADDTFVGRHLVTAGVDGSWFIPLALQLGWQVEAWCANAKGDVVRSTWVVA